MFLTILFPSVNPLFLMFVLQHLVLTMTSVLLARELHRCMSELLFHRDMQEVH